MGLNNRQEFHHLNPTCRLQQQFHISDIPGPSLGLYTWEHESRVYEVVMVRLE